MTEDNFDFDLTERTFPLKIQGEDYVLVEADEDSAKRYKNAAMRSTKFGAEGKPSGVDGLADIEPMFVSMCLFKLDAVQNRHPVPLKTILSWPHRIIDPMYRKARELSGMKDDDESEIVKKLLKKRLASLKETETEQQEMLKSWLSELNEPKDLVKN